jgi:ferric-dicitrate binding protein FerR (iron transport regulator)
MEPNTDIADQNTERLIQAAYQSEPASVEFAAQLEAKLIETATKQQQRQQTMATPPAPSKRWRRIAGVLGGLAACILLVYAFSAMQRKTPGPVKTPNGDEQPKLAGVSWTNDVRAGMAPRLRPEGLALTVLGEGKKLTTKSGERRLVQLSDGTRLFVNGKTEVEMTASRRLTLHVGQVYLEVAPLDGAPQFVVKSGDREITATGTHFAVQADAKAAGVIVTQGKVAVKGMESEVIAGQQVVAGSFDISTALRASHTLEWTRELMAAAETPMVPGCQHAGGALLALDPQGQEIKLALRQYHIDVQIEDGFARTTIDQTYFNTTWERLEGTFYFPLPADASLSRLAMYVANGNECKLMEGGMAERKHAADVYETIRYQRRDPALLEWLDGSTFKMRVFPLEAKQEKRIILSYMQKLPSLYGVSRYRFAGGHNMPIVREWSFNARIKNGERMKIANPNQEEMQIIPQSGDALIKHFANNVKPDADVVFEMQERDQLIEKDLPRFAMMLHENHQYLMLRYRPALASTPKRERRDWIVLFESSAQRDSLLAGTQVDILRHLLKNAEYDDTFVLLTANTKVQVYSPDEPKRAANASVPGAIKQSARQEARPKNVEEAIKYLQETHLVGALDLQQGLQVAIKLAEGAKNPHILHIGSGIPAMGERDAGKLARLLPESVRYVGVGVGKRWNRAFMKAAAERTNGLFTQINPDETISWRSFELLATLNTPRLLDVQVLDANGKTTFLMENSVLAQGEELCAVTRVDASKAFPGKVIVKGTLDGKEYVKELPVMNVVSGAGYLPRTWAKQEIDRLLAAGSEKNKDSIITLSKAMYVMSPFTSLLVLETEADYVNFKVDRGRKDHWAMYPCPDKIPLVFEPNGKPPVKDEKKPAAKPTADELLRTFVSRPMPAVYGAQEMFTIVDLNPAATEFDTDIQYLNERLGEVSVPGSTNANEAIGIRGGDKAKMPINLPAPGGFGWPVNGGGFRPLRSGFPSVGTHGSATAAPRLPASVDTLPDLGIVIVRATSDSALKSVISEIRPGGGRPMPVFKKTLKVLEASHGQIEKSMGASWRNGVVFETPNKDFYMRAGLRFQWDNSWFLQDANKVDGELKSIAHTKQLPNENLLEKLLGQRKETDGELLSDLAMPIRQSSFNFVAQSHLYARPQIDYNQTFFTDLIQYAPGLHNMQADILTALEREADVEQPKLGNIDAAAREMIDGSRSANWRSLSVAAEGPLPGYKVHFNGIGQFSYERILVSGLREQVVCDGTTLWHLYPEIGLAAKRLFSRHHQNLVLSFDPAYLPGAEDLARGYEVKAIDARTVALMPVGAAQLKPDQKYHRVHLIFAKDGRLSERRILEMPAGKTLLRQIYQANGTVEWRGEGDKQLAKQTRTITSAKAPGLEPSLGDLVVMSMPIRTRDQIAARAAKLGADAGSDPAFVAERFISDCYRGDPYSNGYADLRQLLEEPANRKLGYLTLLNVANANLILLNQQILNANGNKAWTLSFDAEKSNNPLAIFLAQGQREIHSNNQRFLKSLPGPKDGFIQKLARFRNLWLTWHKQLPIALGEGEGSIYQAKVVEFLQETTSPTFVYAVLDAMQRRSNTPASEQMLSLAERRFTPISDPLGLGYVFRYEHARSLLQAGRVAESAKRFRELHADALQHGTLPPIDQAFRDALQAPASGGPKFADFTRKTLDTLLSKKRLVNAFQLARQTEQLGDDSLSGEIVATILTRASDKERHAVTLVGIRFLAQRKKLAEADRLLAKLLEEKKLAQHAELWRFRAEVTRGIGQTATSIACLEKALDLEFADMPELVNLESLRADYRAVLAHYQTIADASLALERAAPKALLAKVIQAADRWRLIDAGASEPCLLAGKIFHALGERELAWDYWTTPIDLYPGEARPWLELAETMKAENDLERADKAFAEAFEMEQTNPEILFRRAGNLMQMAQPDLARQLYRQIASGTWQDRFAATVQQARGLAGQ